MKKFVCKHCGRAFILKTPHRCNTGFRKRHLEWVEVDDKKQKYYSDNEAFLINNGFMNTSIYKAQGRTPDEAFRNIWNILRHTDDFALRKNQNGLWEIRLEVVAPTQSKREEFEKEMKFDRSVETL